MFDKKNKLHDGESDQDNFDLIRDTSGKIALLKPILKPDIYRPIQNLVRRNCAPLLKQIINSMEPEDSQHEEDTKETKIKSDDIPDWVLELAQAQAEEKPQEEPHVTEPTDAEGPNGPKRKIPSRKTLKTVPTKNGLKGTTLRGAGRGIGRSTRTR